MLKDVSLYMDSVHAAGTASGVGEVVLERWQALREKEPEADFTRIFPLIAEAQSTED